MAIYIAGGSENLNNLILANKNNDLKNIDSLLTQQVRSTLEDYNAAIDTYKNQMTQLTKEENQNSINELAIKIKTSEENKIEMAYDFAIQQIAHTSSLVEIEGKIGELKSTIQEYKKYLLIDNRWSLQDKKEMLQRINDCKSRKNALEKIKKQRVAENIIKENPSLLNKKSFGTVLFLLSCLSTMKACCILLSLFLNGGLQGMFLMMQVQHEGIRYMGALIAFLGSANTYMTMQKVFEAKN